MDLDTICYLHSRWLLFDLKAISKISFARIRDSRCFSSLLPICVSMENPRHLEDRLKSRIKADNYGLHPYHKSEVGQDMKRSADISCLMEILWIWTTDQINENRDSD